MVKLLCSLVCCTHTFCRVLMKSFSEELGVDALCRMQQGAGVRRGHAGLERGTGREEMSCKGRGQVLLDSSPDLVFICHTQGMNFLSLKGTL